MSTKFCPHCESNQNVTEKRVSIPIGNESFTTQTAVCGKCGRYEMTPKIFREMDTWGRGLTKNVVEPQPIFSEAAHRFAEEMANQYGLKRVPLFRVLTAFYLTHVVGRADFAELKKFCDEHAPRRLLNEGPRSKVSVPVRYVLYRKLEIFGEVWEVTHAKAIEEAVLFGLTVLSRKKENYKKLSAIASSLQQYIEDVAQAA